MIRMLLALCYLAGIGSAVISCGRVHRVHAPADSPGAQSHAARHATPTDSADPASHDRAPDSCPMNVGCLLNALPSNALRLTSLLPDADAVSARAQSRHPGPTLPIQTPPPRTRA
ncbi:MAG: hypothetical protein ACRENP_29760 [Longimicrobiales bacterium]